METAGFIPKLVWRWKSHFIKRLTDLYPRAKFCFSHWSFTHRFIQWVFDDMQRTHAPIGSSLYIHRCRFPHISEAKPLIYTLKTWLNYFCISFCKEAVKNTLKFWIRLRAHTTLFQHTCCFDRESSFNQCIFIRNSV